MARRGVGAVGRFWLTSLTATLVYAAACGDGTGPAPVEPMIGALQVSAASPNGWLFFGEGPAGSLETGTYVTGPGTPPLGFGSAKFVIDGLGRLSLGTLAFAGLPLAAVTNLEYWTFVGSASSPAVAPSLQFDVDYDAGDGSTVYQGRLVFEPYLIPATVEQGVWQRWTPLDGRWWSTRDPLGVNCTVTPCICPQSTPCTWSKVRTSFPNAAVHGTNGVLLFRAGGPWQGGFTGYVDKFTIATTTGSETYDFEPSLEPCAFAPDNGSRTVRLTADCTTDHTLYIPNGWTVDGAGFTITAVNPTGADFLGPVIRNGGARAHARGLHIVGQFDGSGACHAAAERLAGIAFESASGTIMFNRVEKILRAPHYGCQEGNGIQVRNPPFDGTHPNTQQVLIQQNTVSGYQKTGILANGDVRVAINSNDISSAAAANGSNLDRFIAANSIQVGFGAAHATIHGNRVQGNDWDGLDGEPDLYYSATAMLIFEVGVVEITNNQIGAGAPGPLDEKTDIGIWVDNTRSVNITNNYIGRHGDDESTADCQSRPDGQFGGNPPADRCDPDGVGIFLYQNPGITNVINNRFAGGWHELQIGAVHDRRNREVSPIQ